MEFHTAAYTKLCQVFDSYGSCTKLTLPATKIDFFFRFIRTVILIQKVIYDIQYGCITTVRM